MCPRPRGSPGQPLGQALKLTGVFLQKFPPRKDFVRAVSLQTGYLIKANGTGACVLYYLTQVDPRGESRERTLRRAPMGMGLQS